jgi:mannose-6-phosphate isomerase-like protein (cupin superfamily)
MEICVKPWGWYKVLEDTGRCKVKLIQVDPGSRLSLQSHSKRREHWYVLQGELTVERGNDAKKLTKRNYVENQFVEIEQGELHRASNESGKTVQFVEIQTGAYFGEDDIVRYEDDYGRI